MAQPFTCPHCGAHDYSIVLSGADVAGATLREDFHWDSATGEYTSEGTIMLDSQSVESESAQAICCSCEQDVSSAVSRFEDQQAGGHA